MGTDAGGSGSPRRRAVGVGGIVGVMGLALIVLLFLPRNYRIQREIRIEAPPAVVFEQVVDLRKNPAWSPWVAADPGMQITYGPITRGVGATSRWTSSNDGRGSVRVEEAEAPTRIQNALGFGDLGSGEGVWTFEPVQEGETQVTWTLTAHAPGLLGGLFAVMADTMVGPSFEDGLSRLKQVVESGPAEQAGTPDPSVDPVVEALRRNPITYTRHGRERMACRQIDEEEVRSIVHGAGTRNPERTRNDGECPSHALEGETADGQSVRIVVAACADETRVVTAIDLGQDWPCDD